MNQLNPLETLSRDNAKQILNVLRSKKIKNKEAVQLVELTHRRA